MSTDSPAPAPRPLPGPPVRRAPPPALRGAAPAAGAAAPARGKLRLADATSGLVREMLSLLVYGVEGVGKTSLAAGAPRPLLIGAENGSAEIGLVRRVSPATFEDVLGVLEDLRTEAHDYQSVVLDSLDWLEPLVWAATCARGGKATIEAFGYGKGYVEALTEWRMVIKALEGARVKGLNVILVAHSVCKLWKNPDANQGDYDRYSLKLHEKAAGLWKEWAKAVLFANFERATVEVDNRFKGLDTGRRLLHTRMAAAFDAKNRLWLPPEIPLGWEPLRRAIEAGEKLRERYYAALAKVDEATRASAQEHVEQSNYDPAVIEQVIAGLTNP